ncbi:MAG: DUF2863 family protein [Betaproteobacteria bacterium]
MKRLRSKSPLRLNRDAEKLISLSTGLVASGSRAEDRYWEAAIMTLAEKMMTGGHDAAIESALDHTFKSNLAAHDVLIELIESGAECTTLEINNVRWDVLLLAIPLVAWSKYSVPSGPVSSENVASIVPHLHGHVLADNARLSMSPYLYSIDQMPRDFSSVHKMAQKLGEAAITGTTPKFDFTKMSETAPLLADTRFLLAAVAVSTSEALFRWQDVAKEKGQEKDGDSRGERVSRTECLEKWIAQCRPNLARLLPGCAFESLLPDAYFVNCRESDRRVRPYGVRSAINFLETTLKTTAPQLRAIVAGFGEEHVDEYRIAFTKRGSDDVVHGIVWPLFGREDDDAQPTPWQEVESVLSECKLGEVTRLSGLFAPEFCEDCGAPLFADADSEMVHPELPEEAETPVAHYH